ncbi:hypothetical protein KDL01_04350 [Actinospica durhamensis]|uniref:Secreted protein n=1 Tax=Actinospica durhamensis TaxID=1508375 RepID=A0A941ERI0_9ACTN|nr:hypothetical protein [Actinospica durhamensis]MBR7832474.1 hypothetical protein [Actinospica durhamensis]
MIRTVRSAALIGLLATAALAGIPAIASADAAEQTPGITINCEYCQIAGGDIFNAGRDNIVGNDNGTGEMPGVGLPPTVRVEFRVGRLPSEQSLYKVVQEGGGAWPARLPENSINSFPVDDLSYAVYESAGGLGHVRINGFIRPTCTSDGDLICFRGERDLMIQVRR